MESKTWIDRKIEADRGRGRNGDTDRQAGRQRMREKDRKRYTERGREIKREGDTNRMRNNHEALTERSGRDINRDSGREEKETELDR